MNVRIPNPDTKEYIVPGLIYNGKSFKRSRITVRATKDNIGKKISFSDDKRVMLLCSYGDIKDLIEYLEG